MVKTVTWFSLLFLLFSIITPITRTKAEESKWAIQVTKERKGTSKLAIKSLAVSVTEGAIFFRCESFGNWNLGYDNYRVRVEINTKGEKKPSKKNTFQTDVFQLIQNCDECLFQTLKNLETNETIPTLPLVAYVKDEGIMIFGLSRSEINLLDNNFSISLSITTKSGGVIDSAPADHSLVVYDPNGASPDPYFFVDQVPIDLGQISQGQEKEASFWISNWGSGSFMAEVLPQSPQIQIKNNIYTLLEEEDKEVFFIIQPKDLTIGKHKEQILVKAMEREKIVTVLFEVMPIPKLISNPKELDFGSLGRTDSKTKSLTIKNENPGNLVGTLKVSASWIHCSIDTFDGEEIDLDVTISNLPRAGLFEEKITVLSNGGTLIIPVKVNAIDIIRFSEPAINFGEVDVDKPIKILKKFRIIHEAKEKLSLKLKLDADWVKVFPEAVYLNNYGEETIELEVDFDVIRKQLKTYQTTLVIRSESETWKIPITITTIKFEPKLTWLKEESDPTTFENKIVAGKKIQINLVFQNTGTGELKAEAKLQKSNEWQIDPPSFALISGEKSTIKLSIDTTGLKNKIVSNILQITSNGGVVSIPLEVHVVDITTIKIRLWIGKKTAFVNEDPIRLDEPPYIQYGSTMVPLRFIGEAFGAKVEWVAEGKGKIIIQLQNHKIHLSIGDTVAVIDDKEYTLAVPPEIIKGRTFVPLRFISEGLGAKIDWYPENQEILITLALAG